MEGFTYLGSVISNDGSLDKEINSRICKASQALGRLKSRVLKQHNIKVSAKLKVYQAVVITSLLYGWETWTLYGGDIKQLERFHMHSLRSILGVRWQDKVTNLEVLDRAETTSIEAMVLKPQLRWTGHVIRMDDSRIPKSGELCHGKRKRPQKRCKDNLKANIKYADIPPKQLEKRAQERGCRRTLTKLACESFERTRRKNIAEARSRRKAAAAAVSREQSQFQCMCQHCGRPRRSRIGLLSHLRVHNR